MHHIVIIQSDSLVCFNVTCKSYFCEKGRKWMNVRRLICNIMFYEKKGWKKNSGLDTDCQILA